MGNDKGVLYVVATPIGNMKDITLRALEVLARSDYVLCEDTRKTLKIFTHYNISGPKLISYNEHNENKRIPEVIKLLEEGKTVSLVSNAGTPTVQDPGYRLVKTLRENSFEVIPVPGPSALIAAISVSGLPTDSFVFYGFLPRKKGKRKLLFERWCEEEKTIIFYESPRRIRNVIQELQSFDALLERRVFIAREMTKKFETYKLLPLKQIEPSSLPEKGEYVIILEGRK